MIIYFTSGTTAMPKMTVHNFTYPLGHIVTAKYWQRVVDGGLHLTLSDSGWAKFGWGKIYGQWICGAVQFVYDMDKFEPCTLLKKMEKYKLSTFCAPPTVYRFLLQQEIEKYDLSSIVHCSTAGEPPNPGVYNRFLNRTGLKILNGFGQTETTVLVANFEWLDIYPGAMGKPNPSYKIDVVDENDCSCPAGVEGGLVIRGPIRTSPPDYSADTTRIKKPPSGFGTMTPIIPVIWCTVTSTACLMSFLGFSITLSNWISAIIIFIPILISYIKRMDIEEKLLAEHFGDEYTCYAKSTKRLIPGIY